MGNDGRICVMGMMVRKGEIRAKVAKSKKGDSIRQVVRQNVDKNAKLYTDSSPAYDRLEWEGFNRESVCHGTQEYVRGDVHTNGIESFWALFKRGYHGVYHWMSKQHLQRYADEFAFRWNNRHTGLSTRFAVTMQKVTESQRLPYKELIA